MVKGQKYHMLYKTTCTVTGNFYIGVHSTTNLEDEYLGSGKRLMYSIQKHGKEKHTREILELFVTREELLQREREVVNEDLMKDEKCLNLKNGGEGGSDFKHLTSKDRSLQAKQRWKNSEYRRKISESVSIENRRKYRKGNYVPSFTGMKHSEKTKEKMRGHRKQNGVENSQYGKIWIFSEKLQKSMKIKCEDLDYFCQSGWKKGRKMY
jgi:hypothetical protein